MESKFLKDCKSYAPCCLEWKLVTFYANNILFAVKGNFRVLRYLSWNSEFVKFSLWKCEFLGTLIYYFSEILWEFEILSIKCNIHYE